MKRYMKLHANSVMLHQYVPCEDRFVSASTVTCKAKNACLCAVRFPNSPERAQVSVGVAHSVIVVQIFCIRPVVLFGAL